MAKRKDSGSKKDPNLNDINELNKYINKIINALISQNGDAKGIFDNNAFQYGINIKFDSNGMPTIESANGNPAIQSQVKKLDEDPLFDIIEKDNEVIIDISLPGVKAENIRIDSSENSVHIAASGESHSYNKKIDLPVNVDPLSGKATFNNGILEIVFKKKSSTSSSIGIEIK
ncbi:MAG: Hsp20/alpha crystallin family protein [Candidatus Micrarchaeia archaeon]